MIMLVFLVAGCNRLQSSKQKAVDTARGNVLLDKVYIGTKGITMTYMKNSPPRRIYDSNNINLLLELKNQGAHATDGKIFLTGYDPKIIKGIDPEKRFRQLEGKSKFNSEGDLEVLEFNSNTIRLPKGTDIYPVRFLASMCYQYETLANPIVCIDPKFYDVSVEEKACQVRDVPMGGGQGAPISVRNVRVDTIKDKAHFKIEIENAAKGKVVRYNDCPLNLKYDDLNKIKYQVTLAGDRPEKCTPQTEVRMVNNKATIICTFRIPNQNKYAYSTPLEIKLNYGYMDSVVQDVEIVKIPS